MLGNDEYYFFLLNFVNAGMIRWFYDPSAILDYESYDTWA